MNFKFHSLLQFPKIKTMNNFVQKIITSKFKICSRKLKIKMQQQSDTPALIVKKDLLLNKSCKNINSKNMNNFIVLNVKNNLVTSRASAFTIQFYILMKKIEENGFVLTTTLIVRVSLIIKMQCTLIYTIITSLERMHLMCLTFISKINEI